MYILPTAWTPDRVPILHLFSINIRLPPMQTKILRSHVFMCAGTFGFEELKSGLKELDLSSPVIVQEDDFEMLTQSRSLCVTTIYIYTYIYIYNYI